MENRVFAPQFIEQVVSFIVMVNLVSEPSLSPILQLGQLTATRGDHLGILLRHILEFIVSNSRGNDDRAFVVSQISRTSLRTTTFQSLGRRVESKEANLIGIWAGVDPPIGQPEYAAIKTELRLPSNVLNDNIPVPNSQSFSAEVDGALNSPMALSKPSLTSVSKQSAAR